MASIDGVVRIAQVSDLPRRPYFEASLLERAIGEINELRPDIVVCSGDLTTFGFKHEYLTAREYLDRIDCDALVVVPATRLAERRVRPLRGCSSGTPSFTERRGDRRRGLERARPRPRSDRPGRPLDRGSSPTTRPI